MKSFYIGMTAVIVVAVVGLVVVLSGNPRESGNDSTDDSAKIVATMYKSPNCGCCANHAAYLRRNGFDVQVVETDDIGSIKQEYGIPSAEQSCHTTVIDGYAVEGHMPIEAINDLLTDRPEVKGIGLAGMPAGSPGMPGVKQGSFEVYSFVAGGEVVGYNQY